MEGANPTFGGPGIEAGGMLRPDGGAMNHGGMLLPDGGAMNHGVGAMNHELGGGVINHEGEGAAMNHGGGGAAMIHAGGIGAMDHGGGAVNHGGGGASMNLGGGATNSGGGGGAMDHGGGGVTMIHGAMDVRGGGGAMNHGAMDLRGGGGAMNHGLGGGVVMNHGVGGAMDHGGGGAAMDHGGGGATMIHGAMDHRGGGGAMNHGVGGEAMDHRGGGATMIHGAMDHRGGGAMNHGGGVMNHGVGREAMDHGGGGAMDCRGGGGMGVMDYRGGAMNHEVGCYDAAPLPPPHVVAVAASPAIAGGRERHRVFVKSGVTVEVTEDILQHHFSFYGNVTDVYIPRVMPTQIPKGFAYISFDSEDGVHRALELESHEINGKHFPIGRAEPRPFERGLWHHDQDNLRRQHEYNHSYAQWGGQQQEPRCNGPPHPVYCPPPPGPPTNCVEAPIDPPYNPEAPYYHTEAKPYPWMSGPPRPPSRGGPGNNNISMKRNACRIFVGGVPDVLLEEDMKVHFEKYGKVEDVYFPKEKETRKRRGFCYVRFDNPKAADAAAARSPRTIGGNEIGEIKIAQPRPGEAGPYYDFHGYGSGAYGPPRMGNSYNSRSYERRPPTRFRPY